MLPKPHPSGLRSPLEPGFSPELREAPDRNKGHGGRGIGCVPLGRYPEPHEYAGLDQGPASTFRRRGKVAGEREQGGHRENRAEDVDDRSARLHEIQAVHQEQAGRQDRDGHSVRKHEAESIRQDDAARPGDNACNTPAEGIITEEQDAGSNEVSPKGRVHPLVLPDA